MQWLHRDAIKPSMAARLYGRVSAIPLLEAVASKLVDHPPSRAANADHFYGDADQRRRPAAKTGGGGSLRRGGEGFRGSETGGLERSSNRCVSGDCCSEGGDGDPASGRRWLCDVGAGQRGRGPSGDGCDHVTVRRRRDELCKQKPQFCST